MGFIEDNPHVQELIQKGAGKVVIHDDSEEGLIAGFKKITGLDNDKYYMIENLDANDAIVYTAYVKEDGTLTDDLTEIKNVPGGEIKGLENDLIYRVTAAKHIPDNTNITVINHSPTVVSVSDGAITLRKAPNSTTYTMAVSQIIYTPNGFQGVMVHVESEQDNEEIPPTTVNINLRGENTISDYILIQNAAGKPDYQNFKVLKVIINESFEIIITINPPVFPTDLTLTYTGITNFTQENIFSTNSDNHSITISVTEPTGVIFTNLDWRYNNAVIGTGNSITLDFYQIYVYNNPTPDPKLGLIAKGVHTITVAGLGSNGWYYAGTVVVTVN